MVHGQRADRTPNGCHGPQPADKAAASDRLEGETGLILHMGFCVSLYIMGCISTAAGLDPPLSISELYLPSPMQSGGPGAHLSPVRALQVRGRCRNSLMHHCSVRAGQQPQCLSNLMCTTCVEGQHPHVYLCGRATASCVTADREQPPHAPPSNTSPPCRLHPSQLPHAAASQHQLPCYRFHPTILYKENSCGYGMHYAVPLHYRYSTL